MEFFHISRFLTLLVGFALVIASINLLKRKRRAHGVTLGMTILAIPFHIGQGLDDRAAAGGVFLVLLLIATRGIYTVRSGTPEIAGAAAFILAAAVTVLAYSVAGFWLLDRKQFHANFDLIQSIRQSLRYLSLGSDPALIPKTRYARWFLDSLYANSTGLVVFVLYVLYQPVYYRFRINPREIEAARDVVRRHGRSALDFFKYWPYKSLYFSKDGESLIAYRVGGGNCAVVLGDPVAPPGGVGAIIREFREYGRGARLRPCIPPSVSRVPRSLP